MTNFRIVEALLLGIIVIGCDSNIRQELDAVKTELENLKNKQSEDDLDRVFKDMDRVAYLRPGDEGYSTIQYDLGVLTVQLADISPYANGSKVRLKFGNPLSSSINGLEAIVEWGRTDSAGSPESSSQKSKDITLSESLRGGAWTTISIVLDGIPPSDLGFVRIKRVTHRGISLNR